MSHGSDLSATSHATSHLWDPKQRVHISRWRYKRQSAHVDSFHMIVGYFLTIVS